MTTLRILPDKEGRKGIDVLTGKGKLADYPGDYQKGESPLTFEELLDILQKNKGRLGVSLSDAGLVERVRTAFRLQTSSLWGVPTSAIIHKPWHRRGRYFKAGRRV